MDVTSEKEKPKIAYVICGGTIFSEWTPEGRRPVTSGEELLQKYLPRLSREADVATREIWRLDSTDMHYPEYRKVAEEVCKFVKDGYAPVDAQGTDSMTYGAAFLVSRIPFKRVPFVIAGSMHSIGEEDSDALPNLEAATMVAMRKDFPGTYVCVNEGEIHRAARSVKVKPNEPRETEGVVSTVPVKRSFSSGHYPVIGGVVDGEFEYASDGERVQKRFVERQERRLDYFRPLFDEFGEPLFLPHYENVFVIDLHPNFQPEILDAAFKDNYRAVLIKAPGTGGIPNSPRHMALIPKIEKWVKDGRSVVIAPKITHAIVDDEYEVNRRSVEAGAVITYDMHADFALAKAELAAGLAQTPAEFKKLLYYNFEDEIDERLIPESERTSDAEVFAILKKVLGRKNGNGTFLDRLRNKVPWAWQKGA